MLSALSGWRFAGQLATPHERFPFGFGYPSFLFCYFLRSFLFCLVRARPVEVKPPCFDGLKQAFIRVVVVRLDYSTRVFAADREVLVCGAMPRRVADGVPLGLRSGGCQRHDTEPADATRVVMVMRTLVLNSSVASAGAGSDDAVILGQPSNADHPS